MTRIDDLQKTIRSLKNNIKNKKLYINKLKKEDENLKIMYHETMVSMMELNDILVLSKMILNFDEIEYYSYIINKQK